MTKESSSNAPVSTAPSLPEGVEIIPQHVSAIKKKIGADVDMEQVLRSGLIEEAQEIADSRQQDFLVWVQADLKAMEDAYRQLEQDMGGHAERIALLKRFALSVKSRGGTFGYDLASMVAKSLYIFCDEHFRPEPAHVTVIRKHLDGLGTIFHRRIAGNGGAVGAELIGSLHKLVEKYK